MVTRRNAIKNIAVFSAGSLAIPAGFEDFLKKPAKKIGLQLYTLRSDMSKDAKGTLEKVAKLGYTSVETFGYNNRKWFGFTASELAAVLKSNGLDSPSGHTFPGSFFLKSGWEETWKVAVEDAKTLGQQYIVIPWLEDAYRKSIDNYKKIAEGLNKAGEATKQASLKLAYHNHDFEFTPVEGQTGFDILANETDSKLVNFELDLFWAVKAGHDPIELFKKHPGRFVMWHVKDMDNTEKKFFTEVGNGVIDFKNIFKQAKKSGMKYFFVEQDVCPGPPISSIEKSIAYIKTNLVKLL
jgi:sugar phosphate isomerase/epimerase